MTAVSITDHSQDGRREPVELDGSTTSSILLNEDTISNADLYCMTPPVYAVTAAEGETSVDAEAVQPEKAGIPGSSYAPSSHRGADNASVQGSVHTQDAQPGPSTPIPAQETTIPDELPPVYFQQLTEDAALASVKRCSVLLNRPAVWLVRRKELALSPLAATVLIKEGILKQKDLELVSQSAGVKRDPNDPLSGIAFATFDTVGDILLGLVQGPVEAAKQVQPILLKHEQAKKGDPSSVKVSVLQESDPFLQADGTPSTDSQHTAWKPTLPEIDRSSQEQRLRSDSASLSQNSASELKATGNAAKEVALSTGKGIGRMVGAGLKAPMTFTHAITRGFHNVPKVYGGGVREYENVVGMKSGLSVSAKSFGYGLSDGLKDFFVQPIVGAKNEGGKGFVKGFGKGIGNVICKPAAGACGLLSYSFVGVYKEIQGLMPAAKDDFAEAMTIQGEAEYNQAASQTRMEVVRRWCQMTMRQNGKAPS